MKERIGLVVLVGALASFGALAQKKTHAEGDLATPPIKPPAPFVESEEKIDDQTRDSRISLGMSKTFTFKPASPEAIKALFDKLAAGENLQKTHFVGSRGVNGKLQLREDIRDGGSKILEVYHELQINRTDTELRISTKPVDFKVIARMAGGYAKSSIVSSDFSIVAKVSPDGNVTIDLMSSSVSKHPGGLARAKLNDAEFYDSVRKDSRAAFDLDTTRIREILREIAPAQP